MITVLVTGPIGGGKSTACRYLESMGYPVYDCDSRCKRLYAEVPGLKQRIEKELGIAFEELGRIFEDDDLRMKLEALVYPLLVEDLKAWKSELDSPLAFVESAIALDKPCLDGLYDRVLLITARKELRLARNSNAAARGHLQNYDLSRVDGVIYNDSTKSYLYKKINQFIDVCLPGRCPTDMCVKDNQS